MGMIDSHDLRFAIHVDVIIEDTHNLYKDYIFFIYYILISLNYIYRFTRALS